MSLFRRRSSPDAGTNGASHERAPGAEPVDGYDGTKMEKVIHGLRGYSQTELKAIEDYERANADRQPVLDKLRYLRQDEPLDGYDELDVDGVTTKLAGADHETLARVREYERKFKRRDGVLSHIANAGSNGNDGRAAADSS